MGNHTGQAKYSVTAEDPFTGQEEEIACCNDLDEAKYYAEVYSPNYLGVIKVLDNGVPGQYWQHYAGTGWQLKGGNHGQ